MLFNSLNQQYSHLTISCTSNPTMVGFEKKQTQSCNEDLDNEGHARWNRPYYSRSESCKVVGEARSTSYGGSYCLRGWGPKGFATVPRGMQFRHNVLQEESESNCVTARFMSSMSRKTDFPPIDGILPCPWRYLDAYVHCLRKRGVSSLHHKSINRQSQGSPNGQPKVRRAAKMCAVVSRRMYIVQWNGVLSKWNNNKLVTVVLNRFVHKVWLAGVHVRPIHGTDNFQHDVLVKGCVCYVTAVYARAW